MELIGLSGDHRDGCELWQKGKTTTIKQTAHVTRPQLPYVNAGPGVVSSYFSRETNKKRSHCNREAQAPHLEETHESQTEKGLGAATQTQHSQN